MVKSIARTTTASAVVSSKPLPALSLLRYLVSDLPSTRLAAPSLLALLLEDAETAVIAVPIDAVNKAPGSEPANEAPAAASKVLPSSLTVTAFQLLLPSSVTQLPIASRMRIEPGVVTVRVPQSKTLLKYFSCCEVGLSVNTRRPSFRINTPE